MISLYETLIAFVIGVVLPFITHWTTVHGWNVNVESALNFALSAVASAIVTVPFSGSWQTFLVAFATAWVGTLRGHYLGLAQQLYANQVNQKS